MIKTIIIIAFILIIVSLGSALFHLVKNQGESKKTVNSLTLRISLSLILFILLFVAVATGMIKPHGLGANIQRHQQSAQNN